jgi:hypothetical protein
MHVKIRAVNLKGRDILKELVVDGRILLKCSLWQQYGRVLTRFLETL